MSTLRAQINEYSSFNTSYSPAISIQDQDYNVNTIQQPQIIPMNSTVNSNLFKPPQQQEDDILEDNPEFIKQEQLEESLTPEEKTKKLEIIDQLSDYEYSRFSDRIKSKYPDIFQDYEQSTLEELQSRLSICQRFIQKKGGSKQAEFLFKSIISVCDGLFLSIGMKVQGASEKICNDPDLLDIVEEIRLKYRMKSMEPEYRLGCGILSSYFTIHGINSRMIEAERVLQFKEIEKKAGEHLDKKISNKLEENFKDI